MAEKGKLEFKLVANPNATKESEKDGGIERILNMPPSMLAMTLLAHGKIMDKCSEELELKKEEVKSSIQGNENMKAKFEDLTKERAEMEETINKILEEEKLLQNRYSQMVENLEDLCVENRPPPSPDTRKRILAIREDWRDSLIKSESGADRLSGSPIHSNEENLTLFKQASTVKDVHVQLDKLISERKLKEVVEALKVINYNVSGYQVEEGIQVLILACKILEKQLHKVASEAGIEGGVELEEEIVNEIIAEFEQAKNKYALIEKTDQSEKIQLLEKQIQELQQQIGNKSKEIEQNVQTIKQQGKQISSLEELLKSKQDENNFTSLVEVLSKEHTTALNKLQEFLTPSQEPLHNNNAGANNENIQEFMIQEIKKTKDINLYLAEMAFAVKEGKIRLSNDEIMFYQEKLWEILSRFNELYKGIFVEENTKTVTVDYLLNRLERKNLSIKEMFVLFEKYSAVTDEILSKKSKEIEEKKCIT